ncbi:MAG TPA: TonB-dependent receptor [Bryobacteraceae bacterium]|nr:TonB-dependent receptor [Bryobacteraceae bacterium]
MRRRIIWLVAAVALLTGRADWAQETRGTIAGRITDPSGAVIPGATVVVTNVAMGTKTNASTNQDGIYQATFLIPGMYQVEALSAGFKQAVRGNIELRVADRLEVNLELQIGASDQSVTVTAETPLLSSETASVGTVVDSQRVANLPLSYGNPFELIGAAAGVAFTGDARLDRPFEPTHIVGYAMAGSRGNLGDVTLDGAPTTATANGNQVIASYVPPTDIVQEFKVQTATFDAQFGQTQGGVTNISMKSGTNQFHGAAGYTVQRPSFWANDFFNNQQGKPRPDFLFNRWGGAFGGPVIIPKVYNGKNKTFFEWGYEGIHDSRPRHDDSTYTVPTTAEKAGDFSALLQVPGTGSSYQIYNPFSRRAAASGRYQEDPFPGNIIPSSLFNPVGVKALSYFPTPLSSGDAAGLKNMVDSSVTEKAKYYNHSWRVDHNVSQKQRIFVRASIYRRDSLYNNYFDNLSTGVAFQFLSRAAVFDDVYTLSPTMVLNTGYSYNRFIRYQNGNPAADGFDLSSLGFPSSYASQIPKNISSFPQFNMTGYIPTGSAAGENRPVMNHTVKANLTKIAGTHSIRTGVEFRAYQENDKFFGFQQTGTFNFDSTWTRGPLDNSAVSPGSIGQSVAALLLGLPSSSSNVARSADYAEQSNSWGFYVQDDWKISPRLTLNLGLRYEFEQPLHERYNKSVLGFDPSYVQPFSAQAAKNFAANDAALITQISTIQANGGLTFAGVNGNPSGLYNTPKTQLMPRIGLAFQADPNTVVRAGFGMFYGFLGERRSDVIQSGFSQNTNVVPTVDNINFTGTLSNPFGSGIATPVGSSGGYQTFLGQGITFFNQNPLAPRVMRWEVGLQHVFKGNLLLDANYTGNKTVHIDLNPTGNPNIVNQNSLPDQYLCTSPFRDNTCNNYLTGTVPNPFYGLVPGNTQTIFTNTTIARSGLLVPFPEFGSVQTSRNQGYSWYHSFVLSVEKRFAKGYSVSGNYTYSKFMQADELLNAADPAPVRVISDQDVPQRFSISSVGELPFGKNKRFLSNTNPVISRLVGGWLVSGIFSYQVGFPLAWGNVLYVGDPHNIALPADQRTVDHWFNTAGFDTLSADQLVNNLRTFPLRFSQIRGRNTNNVDIALIKDTRITEGRNLQFRAEALNAFNHPGFPAPVLTPTSTTFGTIVASNQAGYPRRLQLSLKYIF